MNLPDVNSSVPLESQRRIDAVCLEFERAWKDDRTAPRIEAYLAQFTGAHRGHLLRELLQLELNYRRDDTGKPLTDSQVCALHPDLMPDIAEQISLLRDGQSSNNSDVLVTQELPSSFRDSEPTIDHTSTSASGSRGLHIRCPHCSNPVELLTDTPLESITCRTCGSAFSLVDQGEQTREAPTLKSIGRFDLVARLGLGGFGTVWKARDRELDRTVAVKIPRKGQLARDEVEQFLKEARSAAQLRHPNIVSVHEVGRDGETIFIVSDYIRGVSLSDWLSGATPEAGEIARLMAIIADALQHAHDNGIIHRDLKPSNVLLDDHGQPHVMDFGLAKREVGEIAMTMDGQVLGTPAYMSPEQAGGQSRWIDRRTDIYSLGVMLFRMLTGELPFRGNAQMQIHQRLTEDPPDPRKLNRYLHRDLSTICVKCLERDPNRRFSTSKELAEELRRFLRKEPILSRPISRTERVLRWSKRNPALTAAGLLTLFLAIAGPITAVVIAGQRNRLGELVSEKDNLIKKYASDKEQDASELARLRDALDIWEGRANPWKLWPPKPAEEPRKMLMQRMADEGERLTAPWQQTADEQQQAFGHLALAILSDELGQSDEAVKQYEKARDVLTKLAAGNPAATQYEIALADCYRRLARLQLPKDRESASQDLEQGRAISRQLAASRDDPRIHADWLASEIESGTVKGFAGAMQNLQRAQKISEDFIAKLPKDPAGLYELACYLAGREPVLTSRISQTEAN